MGHHINDLLKVCRLIGFNDWRLFSLYCCQTIMYKIGFFLWLLVKQKMVLTRVEEDGKVMQLADQGQSDHELRRILA